MIVTRSAHDAVSFSLIRARIDLVRRWHGRIIDWLSRRRRAACARLDTTHTLDFGRLDSGIKYPRLVYRSSDRHS
jgi:hypothetical protein